jgi:glycosyltransferase involved in cell wall biosynthesis
MKVVLIDEVLTREQVYSLQAACDCLLSLHRAEGFGLAPAEMMYLGKPVIATGWSGNMEFMTPMNSFPVEYTLEPLQRSIGVYQAGLNWAEPSVEHAAHCLLRLLNDKNLASQIGARGAKTMRTEFSARAIGKRYRERLALVSQR